MTELSEICLSGKFQARNSFRLLEIGSSSDNQAFMDGAFNLGKRAGLCLRYTIYGPL